MTLPINGRIAIIDDKIEQAIPLINALSKKRCSFSYYSGELKYLPTEDSAPNDIRLLFLDINLIDNTSRSDKELRGKLIPVLKRIISKDNYPYIIVYWSRHEKEHSELIKDIFEKELNDRRPILYMSHNKLNYFDLDGNIAEDFEQNVEELFAKVTDLIEEDPAYSYMLNWENQIHSSADRTLQDVFSSYHSYENWAENSNFIISKLGESYTGRSNYKLLTPEDKVKNAFQAFNNVFYDTQEYSTSITTISKPQELIYDISKVDVGSIGSINKKLLLTLDTGSIEYSGVISEDLNDKSDKIFEDVLNNSFNRKFIENEIKRTNSDKEDREIQKLLNKEASKIRKEIREDWKKIYLVVTPLCDFVQRKNSNNRVVKGMLIKSDYIDYIDDKSEAIFISPKFSDNGTEWILVINYRYFFTSIDCKSVKYIKPIFRIRHQLLAEIQSKLARHITRQGVLFIE